MGQLMKQKVKVESKQVDGLMKKENLPKEQAEQVLALSEEIKALLARVAKMREGGKRLDIEETIKKLEQPD